MNSQRRQGGPGPEARASGQGPRSVTEEHGLEPAGVPGVALQASTAKAPATNLLIILVGMPFVAAIGGWLFAGRQPRDMAHQPLE